MSEAESRGDASAVASGDWPVGVAACATDGALSGANAAATAMLAALGGEPIAPNLFAQLRGVAPDLRAAAAQARARGGRLDRVLRGGDVRARLALMGRAGGGFDVLLVDESALARAERDVDRSRARFAALADSLPRAAAFTLDPQGRVTGWSRSAARFEGVDGPDALGRSLDDLFSRAHFPVGAEALTEAAARAGEASVSGLRCRGGTHPRPVTLTLRAVRDAKGAVDGFVAILRDDAGGSTREAELVRLAESDPLTGVLNRRAFAEAADAAFAAARERGVPISALAMDLDDFKLLNDRHGHAAGDRALKAAVDAARSGLREGDLMGRLGGDEFAVALPGADAEHAALVAARLRFAVAAARPEAAGRVMRLTASFGVAEARPGEPFANALERADAALYRAKAAGRDRVTAA